MRKWEKTITIGVRKWEKTTTIGVRKWEKTITIGVIRFNVKSQKKRASIRSQKKVVSKDIDTTPLRCVRMGQMQGAEDEAEGSILTYVTEAEFR